MQKLTITLSDEIAEMVRRRVDSGEYANASEVVRDALKTIEDDPMRGPEIEAWLKSVAVPAYDAIMADPSRGLSAEEVRASLAACYERATRTRDFPPGQTHLDEIFDHIAKTSAVAARRFVGAIVDYCMTFEIFPQRGTKRDDLRPGLRTVGFRRRVTIVFSASAEVVIIVGVFYGGRNFEALLEDEKDRR